jgi:hypothetical protein
VVLAFVIVRWSFDYFGFVASRPFPRYQLQGAGNILRPGSIGCLTLGSPVPLQAAHSTSRSLSSAFNFFMEYTPKRGSLSFPQLHANTFGAFGRDATGMPHLICSSCH